MNRNHGMSRSPMHKIWMSMHSRVRDKSKAQFYRDRGIYVCDRWSGREGFKNFLSDMGNRPNNKSLDRINDDGPYSPQNCRWATKKMQANNRMMPRFSRTGRRLR